MRDPQPAIEIREVPIPSPQLALQIVSSQQRIEQLESLLMQKQAKL
jgi:hypothetical protein